MAKNGYGKIQTGLEINQMKVLVWNCRT